MDFLSWLTRTGRQADGAQPRRALVTLPDGVHAGDGQGGADGNDDDDDLSRRLSDEDLQTNAAFDDRDDGYSGIVRYDDPDVADDLDDEEVALLLGRAPLSDTYRQRQEAIERRHRQLQQSTTLTSFL